MVGSCPPAVAQPRSGLRLLPVGWPYGCGAAAVDVRVPTLVLHRRDNRVFDIEISRLAAAKIRDARFVELRGSETDLFLGDTRPVLAAIRPFLEDESSL